MDNERKQPPSPQDQLNKRLENVSWGLFLIMLGGIWLVPDRFVPDGSWLIGAGFILIGLNIVRYLKQIPISNFSLILGGAALLIGISDFFQVDLPFFPILLIVIGAKLIIQPLIEKRSLENQ
ncbi:MAG: hypothetical protein CVU41_06755 [Chloroflexi bacterium HGW-Chloroflexi-3]|nr:MAG: hypothetical protein CVU41_06755 [Chloroflexi bacterium HGW-Chloroflexi-3]